MHQWLTRDRILWRRGSKLWRVRGRWELHYLLKPPPSAARVPGTRNRKTLDDFWQELLMKFPQLHLRLPNHPNSTIRCGRIFYLVFDTPLEYDRYLIFAFPLIFETWIKPRILKLKIGSWSWHHGKSFYLSFPNINICWGRRSIFTLLLYDDHWETADL